MPTTEKVALKIPLRILDAAPGCKNALVVNRDEQTVFIGSREMCEYIVSSIATLVEEREALTVWRRDESLPLDIRGGFDISISKIDYCLSHLNETA